MFPHNFVPNWKEENLPVWYYSPTYREHIRLTRAHSAARILRVRLGLRHGAIVAQQAHTLVSPSKTLTNIA